MKNSIIKKVGVAGLIKISIVATIYIVLTVAFGDLSYGPIQARPSELLNFLAFIDPLYIIALTLGCAISNFYSFGLIDVIVGSVATLLSTYLMYKSKNMIIASFWPVMNSIFVAAELYFLGLAPFWFSLLTIAIGEFIIMTIVGVPLFKIIFKNKRFVQTVIIDKENKTYIEKLKY
ncbi:MAG: QueT transporter family protein [Clostridiales bacterium]|nr:QueT transporter family protein [Clostridiales bacterium]